MNTSKNSADPSQLITSRLNLRPVITSNTDDLFRIYGDPDTSKFNPAGPYPDIDYTRDVLAHWLKHWEEHNFGNWSISLKDKPERIIGFGGLTIRTYADIPINNLGYRFSSESWGKGMATEFARYAISYGFNQLKMPEISAYTDPRRMGQKDKVRDRVNSFYRNISSAPPPSRHFAGNCPLLTRRSC
ncbi:GNAT family N-acetyltransferase [Pantoea anthophila]|uniref:GNAT family N-acetyltransferase n=1 Tax=Pantoea anthophila TaxID=470931 RepID=UPI003CEE6F0A